MSLEHFRQVSLQLLPCLLRRERVCAKEKERRGKEKKLLLKKAFLSAGAGSGEVFTKKYSGSGTEGERWESTGETPIPDGPEDLFRRGLVTESGGGWPKDLESSESSLFAKSREAVGVQHLSLEVSEVEAVVRRTLVYT